MSDINVGKIIQQKRKALGITQEKLAELSNLSVNYISKMERLDDQNISLKSLAAIAKALDATIPELLIKTPFEVNQSDSANLETRLLAKKSYNYCHHRHVLNLFDHLKRLWIPLSRLERSNGQVNLATNFTAGF